ncbi:ATP-binding protein, partial [Planctomycetota bacterium]
MERTATVHLSSWLDSPGRKPIVLRGARQVGKTWLVRDLARRSGRKLVELNFEADSSWRQCFSDNDPTAILTRIGVKFGRRVEPADSLLFLDEIQAYGEALAKLRWFAEEMPTLPVVAAGSLLEFSLGDHAYSMPVGRIAFYNLDPLGFDEYLRAHDQQQLLEALSAWRPGRPLDAVVHEQAGRRLERFAMTGGMPGIVAAELDGATSESIRGSQRQLGATYRADFARYSGRVATDTLDGVLRSVAFQLGHKFVYSRVDTDARHHHVKAALELLG